MTLRRSSASAASVLLAVGAAALAAGVRVNTTKSVPLGFYLTSSKPIHTGAYVLLCPPNLPIFQEALARGYLGAGFCPGGFGLVIKRVLAAKNDVVEIAAEGVRVNGALLAFSVPRTADRAGRPLAPYPVPRFTLGPDEVLLMSDVSATSWDARYYGPVKLSQLQTVIVPLFTW